MTTLDEIEARMRAMVADAGLRPPDRVEHEAHEVWFYWDDEKLAVVVERGDDHSDGIAAASAATSSTAAGRVPAAGVSA